MNRGMKTPWQSLVAAGRRLGSVVVRRPGRGASRLAWAHVAAWGDEAARVDGAETVPGRAGGVEVRLPARSRGPAPGGAADSAPPPEEAVYHQPVLLEEAVHFLAPGPGRLIFDGTLGGGGHTRRLLEEGACVLAFDQDPEALAAARRVLAPFRDRVALVRRNFRELGEVLEEAGLPGVHGILVDLGVSSRQLDEAERGFSFAADGPLDMRMDPSSATTAADLVNRLDESELADLIFRFGEERRSRRIARFIVEARRRAPIATTRQLATIVEKANPRHGARSRIHPATRTFQALRIAVNDELGALEDLLEAAADWLLPGGRLVVISFHSLEDRIVKHFIRDHSAEWIDAPEWPTARPNPRRRFRPVVRKAVEPTPEECARNPRARSARLRVAERLGAVPAP